MRNKTKIAVGALLATVLAVGAVYCLSLTVLPTLYESHWKIPIEDSKLDVLNYSITIIDNYQYTVSLWLNNTSPTENVTATATLQLMNSSNLVYSEHSRATGKIETLKQKQIIFNVNEAIEPLETIYIKIRDD